MTSTNQNNQSVLTWLLILPAFLLVNLTVISNISYSQEYSDFEHGQIVVYFETLEHSGENIKLDFNSARFSGMAHNKKIELNDIIINSKNNKNKQVLIIEDYLPSGDYNQVHFSFDLIGSAYESETILFTGDSISVDIAIDTNIKKDFSSVLFLKWQPEVIAADTILYIPKIISSDEEVPISGSLVFISNEGSDNISVLDRFSNKIVDVLKVGEAPRGMVFSEMSQQLFVANSGDNSISIIDVNSNFYQQKISREFGDSPSRLILSPDEQHLYILNYGSSTLSIIDTRYFQEVAEFPLESDPIGIASDISTGYVYISSSSTDNIGIYEPVNQVLEREIGTNSSPGELLVNRDSGYLYAGFLSQPILSFIDINSERQESFLMNLCSPVSGISYNRNTRALYVSLFDCEEIAIIKPETNIIQNQIFMEGRPGKNSLGPDGRRLYVILPESNQLAIINTTNNKIEALVNVGRKPFMAAAVN